MEGCAFESAIFDFEDFSEEKSSPRKTKIGGSEDYIWEKKL